MSKWQPIETAPKDGTQFIAWISHYYQGKGGHALVLWLPSKNGWHDASARRVQPTHWHPLPEAPDATERNS